MENDAVKECWACGGPSDNDLCDGCEALRQLDDEHEADDPPEDWYDGWADYAEEYE